MKSFEEWKAEYAHRVKLIAGVKTLTSAREMLPHDDILSDCWARGDNPNDLPMIDWDE